MVSPSSVMTTQSGMLPDRVSARRAHPVMCTSEGVQGARSYLNSAHIKTQPEVVASSKLVPFEIQQTLRSRDEPVCVIGAPVRLGSSQNQMLIFTASVGKFVMSFKPQVLRVIKRRVNPTLLQTDESGCRLWCTCTPLLMQQVWSSKRMSERGFSTYLRV